MTSVDRVGEFGAIYLPALQRVRNLWIDVEPLVIDTRYDAIVKPTELCVELRDGFDNAESARFDIQWSELNNYSFHYVDSEDVNWRFDRHPNPHSCDAHFHSPPDATTADAEPSCIRVEEVSLVTRAIIAMWRAAYESGDGGRLNSMSNPP